MQFVIVLSACFWFGYAASSTTTTIPHYHHVKAMSCAYAVALDVNRPCADECANACAIGLGSAPFWSMALLAGNDWDSGTSSSDASLLAEDLSLCSEGALTCAIPVGIKANVDPTHVQTDSMTVTNVASLQKTTPLLHYSSRAILEYDLKTLRQRIANPWKLTYASVMKNARLLGRGAGQCHYVSTMRKLPDDRPVTTDRTPTTNTNKKYIHGYSSGIHFGETRQRVAFGQSLTASKEDTDQTSLTYHHTPSISALIQQHFLRYADSSSSTEENDQLAPPFAVSFESRFPTQSQDGAQKKYDVIHEVDQKLTAYQLETFTTLHWKTHTSPDAAIRTNCLSCTVYMLASWCDMSYAKLGPMEAWAGWHADSRAISLDGSSCGVAPTTCVLQGGEPATSQASCREIVNDESSFFD